MIEVTNDTTRQIRDQVKNDPVTEVYDVWGSFGWVFDGDILHVRVMIADDANSSDCLATGIGPTNPDLTEREVEILQLTAEDLSRKEVADRLGISENTVKFHMPNIFRKLRVNTIAGAVAQGLRKGLIL